MQIRKQSIDLPNNLNSTLNNVVQKPKFLGWKVTVKSLATSARIEWTKNRLVVAHRFVGMLTFPNWTPDIELLGFPVPTLVPKSEEAGKTISQWSDDGIFEDNELNPFNSITTTDSIRDYVPEYKFLFNAFLPTDEMSSSKPH